MNDYKILGLPPAADLEQLKARYRDLMREHHPDKGGSAEVCADMSRAYNNLKDRRARQKHDDALKLMGAFNLCKDCSGRGIRTAKRVTCKFCGGSGWAG